MKAYEAKRGYVVRWDHVWSNGNRIALWWYGPDRGFGQTSGSLQFAEIWPTRKTAEAAAQGKGVVETLVEARQIEAAQEHRLGGLAVWGARPTNDTEEYRP